MLTIRRDKCITTSPLGEGLPIHLFRGSKGKANLAGESLGDAWSSSEIATRSEISVKKFAGKCWCIMRFNYFLIQDCAQEGLYPAKVNSIPINIQIMA
jgi:hypothetical protein